MKLMTSIAIDKHKFIKRLIGVRFSEPQAEAIVYGLSEHINYDQMATKLDILTLRNELQALETRLMQHINTVQYNCFKMTVANTAFIIAFLKLFPN